MRDHRANPAPATTARTPDQVAADLSVAPMPIPGATQHQHVRPHHYAVAAVDNHGRITAAELLQTLDWNPGDIITFTINAEQLIAAGRVAARLEDTTPSRILRRRGHLYLPANIRHRTAISAGDRLLLTADHAGTLRIFPTQLVARILHPYLTQQQP
jgi:bifunctional DNA-binding transcriptional regulator/antitoxin component of YhaV-PrlF toxin-antitoxin module